jgi:hypothetical protein
MEHQSDGISWLIDRIVTDPRTESIYRVDGTGATQLWVLTQDEHANAKVQYDYSGYLIESMDKFGFFDCDVILISNKWKEAPMKLSEQVAALESENVRLREELERITQIRDEYATAASTIALYLKDYCNESLPYPEMIADAARRAGEELANRPQVDPDYLAKLEALVELVAPDIEFKEQTMTDRMTKTQAIVAAYREVRPKEATAK